MTEPKRVSPEEVHDRLAGGEKLLLVCAYEDDEKCDTLPEGAIPLSELRSREASLDRNAEIVRYCG